MASPSRFPALARIGAMAWHWLHRSIDGAKTFIDVNRFADDSDLRPDTIYEGANQP